MTWEGESWGGGSNVSHLRSHHDSQALQVLTGGLDGALHQSTQTVCRPRR